MALWTDVIKPVEVTAFAREVVANADEGSTLASVFPNVQINATTYSWDVGEILSEVAEYRSFDTEAAFGRSVGRGRKTSELAPVSLKKRITEYEQYVHNGANSPESLQAAAERISGELAQAHVNRQALLRGSILTTGRLVINEGKFVTDVDFGRRADFTKTLTGAGLWSDAGSDPVVDLEAWLAAYEAANGTTPTQLITSRRVLSHVKARMLAAGYFGTAQQINVTTDLVNDQLVDRGLPTITVNERRAAGTRVLPDDRIILASESAGGTVWGTPVEANNPAYGLAAGGLEVPGLVVGAYREDDPEVAFIRSTAVVLPVLANPDLTLVAKVL
jgi:hypothetical protein